MLKGKVRIIYDNNIHEDFDGKSIKIEGKRNLTEEEYSSLVKDKAELKDSSVITNLCSKSEELRKDKNLLVLLKNLKILLTTGKTINLVCKYKTDSVFIAYAIVIYLEKYIREQELYL